MGVFIMSKEVWLPIKGFGDRYSVSNLGRVKSSDMVMNNPHGTKTKKKGRILVPNKDAKGYGIVALCFNGYRKTYKVHRLVAIHFIPNTYNKEQVNHLNGIKLDNRAENLEWCTNRENIIHAYSNGLVNLQRGESHHNSKLKREDVLLIIKRIDSGEIMRTIAEDFNVSIASIGYIKKGTNWAHLRNA